MILFSFLRLRSRLSEVGASVWHDEPDFGFSGWADIVAVEPVRIEAGAGCAVAVCVSRSRMAPKSRAPAGIASGARHVAIGGRARATRGHQKSPSCASCGIGSTPMITHGFGAMKWNCSVVPRKKCRSFFFAKSSKYFWRTFANASASLPSANLRQFQ